MEEGFERSICNFQPPPHRNEDPMQGSFLQDLPGSFLRSGDRKENSCVVSHMAFVFLVLSCRSGVRHAHRTPSSSAGLSAFTAGGDGSLAVGTV